MKKLELEASKIIVPTDYGNINESELAHYFKIFDKRKKDIPKAIVTSMTSENKKTMIETIENILRNWENKDHKTLSMDHAYEWLRDVMPKITAARRKDYEEFSKFLEKGPYFLVFGNEITMAAAITNSLIPALYPETDQEAIEQGESLLSIKGRILNDVLGFDLTSMALVSHPYNPYGSLLEVKSVEDKVAGFVADDGFPKEMIKVYKANRINLREK